MMLASSVQISKRSLVRFVLITRMRVSITMPSINALAYLGAIQVLRNADGGGGCLSV